MSGESRRILNPDEAQGFTRWTFRTLDVAVAGEQAPPVRDDSSSDPVTSQAEIVEPLLCEEELARIREQARAEGYADGFAAGNTEANKLSQATLKQSVEHLESIFNIAAQPLDALDEAVEEQLLNLALEVGEALFRQEMQISPENVINIIKDAIALLPIANATVAIHLHPDDATLVATHKSEELPSTWQIVSDEKIEPGGCRITAESSDVDATLANRVELIRTQILAAHA
jgi:flagellar assembly protein FliH